MGRPISPEPPHGTRQRYQLRRDPCRCHDCRRANADEVAGYRLEKRYEGHFAPSWEQTTIPASAYEPISVPPAP